ncbi:MAG: sigma-54 dependent transcriptional regulator [Acidobacteria bacterium]|nr:sigma-54 dependent transcriptional regulator [Acidobacteriota bacterium]MCI0623893.1 sigma-54 dependent transcriptional regulator [Acidobacteriota bacterium]MCI0722726.1 sigma-54 dependent transcriptional regulator [Acidobacteriota bacterium]
MHILIVEDKETLRQMLTAAVEKMGFTVDAAEDGPQAQQKIKQRRYALILTDLRLPKGSGLEVLNYCRELDDAIPVIVMTAYGTIEEAVAAMKRGAFDFIQKPVDLDHLRLLIERALEQERIVRENILLREAFQQAYGFPEIISEDESIKNIEREIQKVARTEATVLIQGESGTGKELFARAIHQLSARAQHPFVAVNCAAIPETLIENELFGHEKGAYTGADSRRIGKFELAHKGTLFLDEIGELPLQVQAKILRVLETKIFERIGSVQTQEADARIVAATNRDLQEAVLQKRFREDLFFRLSVVPVMIPPLRERQGDLRLLARYFLKRFGREFQKENLSLSDSALKFLESYRWPGNIRELQNCMERAVIMCEGTEIFPKDLNLAFHSAQTAAEAPEGFDLSGTLSEASLRAMTLVEKAKIAQALRQAKWNKTKAAEALGVGYKTLLNKIKEYGLEEEE